MKIAFYVVHILFLPLLSVAQRPAQKFDVYSIPFDRINSDSIKNGVEFVDSDLSVIRVVKSTYFSGFEIKTPQGWKPHGIRYILYNGQVTSYTTYKRGIKDGEYKSFHSNGKTLFHYFYVNGLIEGNWTQYNDDESIYEEGEYKKGLKNGKFLVYYLEKGKTRGPLSTEKHYVDDKPSGIWIYYDRSGKIYSQKQMGS